MAYRLPGERLTLDLDGPTVEVERLTVLAERALIEQDLAAAFAAEGFAATARALLPVYQRFVDEAQPTFEIMDHHGPIPPTTAGMLRLPHALGLAMVMGWMETYPVEVVEETAVDKIIPMGELRDELNARLRAARKKPKRKAA